MLDQHLANRAFLVGEESTIADVAIYSYTAHAPEGGSVSFELYPNVRGLARPGGSASRLRIDGSGRRFRERREPLAMQKPRAASRHRSVSQDRPSERVASSNAGEQALQARAGVRDRIERVGRKIIRDFMPDQHRALFAELPFLVIGALDGKDRPWASGCGRPTRLP